jgi:DNA-binding transcriptional LysR family regulator
MERLDLRRVEYFVAVAEELHFGRAAERLHIAQPSLSQQIRQLEAELGVVLLERTSRRVELTSAGRALLREGRATLNQARRAVEAARAAGPAPLAVGFFGSAASVLLPAVLREFGERHPSTPVSVRELLFGSVEEVRGGEVDVAFTRLVPGQSELDIEVIAEEPRVVALARRHPLAARSAVRFAELRDESFVVNPVTPADGAPARWLAEQRRHGLPGRIAATTTSLEEILTLVAAGRGVCLVPAIVARLHPRADVAYVPVSDAEPAVVSLATRAGPLRPAVAAFIRTAREVAAES